jgi:hypothetical protein
MLHTKGYSFPLLWLITWVHPPGDMHMKPGETSKKNEECNKILKWKFLSPTTKLQIVYGSHFNLT